MIRPVAAASALMMMVAACLPTAASAQSLPPGCGGTGIEGQSRLALCMDRCEDRVNRRMKGQPVDAQFAEHTADAWIECLAACRSRHDMAMAHMQAHCGTSPLGTAASMRCEAALIRAAATRLSCHSHCEDATAGDPATCMASCDNNHGVRIARIHDSPRCR